MYHFFMTQVGFIIQVTLEQAMKPQTESRDKVPLFLQWK